MEEKILTYKDVPMGYSLCFSDECTVYPIAWQNGEDGKRLCTSMYY